jgi:aminoglycoside phosphotransferase (APT) family kinase protein
VGSPGICDEPSGSDVVAWLRRERLAGAGEVAVERLPGGVSSDIWRVDLPGRRICVKRALRQLRVARPWEAPTERSRFEWAWLQEVGRMLPASVPRLLAYNDEADMFAMEYLEPGDFRNWKSALSRGDVDTADAVAVANRLAIIHRRTAFDARLAERFATDALFYALRLEPYLVATAARHPDLRPELSGLVRSVAETRLCLVHGDVSPKNILLGPAGPVFLDAECAWYGEPAFDLAFCLNHLLLKCLLRPEDMTRLLASFAAFAGTYLSEISRELRPGLEERAARLLPALLLARVDGKSPVEYITEEQDREVVRAAARPMVAEPPSTVSAVAARWERALVEARRTA